MQWQDEGVVIGTRRYGETSAIIEVMTATHGRHLGLVRGGRSRRLRPVLQPGNLISVTWRARLDEHLGTFQTEPLVLNAARLLGSAVSVYGIQLLAAHLRLLPERDPHPELYGALRFIIDHLDRPLDAAELIARFELLMLEELGFGLDLSSCAATGLQENLVYVSPKSGRAVSRAAGLPWSDKMLELPEFMLPGETGRADEISFMQAFRLTGFFFSRHVWEARGTTEPESRTGFASAVSKALLAEKANEGE